MAKGGKRLNIWLLISLIAGVAYLVYSIVYWGGAAPSEINNVEDLGAAVATALVMPHLICTGIAVLFNALGLFLEKRGFALAGAILYTIALVLFFGYFMFVIVEAICSYIGYATMGKVKKQNQKTEE